MKTRIRGATVVLPEVVESVDVIIDGTQIADINPAISIPVDETIEADGLYLLPGVIDDQVHFREPGLTHKEDIASGSRACAKGGVTTYLEMPNTRPATIDLEQLDHKLAIAARTSAVNYGFYIGATEENLDQLKRAQRTPGIKIFIGSSTGNLLVDEQAALERIFAETSLPITAHCEDEATIRANRERVGSTSDVHDHSVIRDEQAAVVATRRAIELAKRHEHRFHVLHVSTAAEIELVRDHGSLITAEVCPHHLLFNTDDYDRLGTRIQANPSVKTADDNRKLWQALLDGEIQVVATDHAPHTLVEKAATYPASPSGVPAVENSLALMLDLVNQGKCTLLQLVHWMCDAPARVWDIVNKGRIQVGFDADLVLVDLKRRHTIRDERQLTKCGWSPWHGSELTGLPVQTIVMGQTVFAAGQVAPAAQGRAARFDHARGGYWA